MRTRLLKPLLWAISFVMLPVVATALEEPEYTVIGEYDEFELRHYPPYLVAEVDVPGGFEDGGNSAFRVLAGYIFGDNQSAEKMKMTAPVEATPAGGSEKMAMTAPVTATDAENGMTTFAFVMERKYTAESLPVPNDDRIRIREMPERTMAVRRYSGRWTQSRFRDNLVTLSQALADAGLTEVGEPVLARYNSPFSLPPFRRNEVMIEVVRPDH
jgi:hypothetical protein